MHDQEVAGGGGSRTLLVLFLVAALLFALSFSVQRLLSDGSEGSYAYSIACLALPDINASGNATLEARLAGVRVSISDGLIQVGLRYEVHNRGPSTVTLLGVASSSCSLNPPAPPSWRVNVSQSTTPGSGEGQALGPGDKATIRLEATIYAPDLSRGSILDSGSFTVVAGFDPKKGLVIPYSWEPVEIIVEGLNVTISTR